MNEKLDAVAEYLAQHIAGAAMDRADKPGGVDFVIRRGDLEWSVLFTHEFLSSVSVEELPRRLDELQLIEEMTRAEDLPLVVEPSGVRLLSNN